MPRSHKAGRGTRKPRGIYSGTTFETAESAVTMDYSGIHYGSGTKVTPTQIGYMYGTANAIICHAATSGIKIVHGIADYSNAKNVVGGATLQINTGLTTIYGFIPTIKVVYPSAESSVSMLSCAISGGGVTVVGTSSQGLQAWFKDSTSCAWIAFGV